MILRVLSVGVAVLAAWAYLKFAALRFPTKTPGQLNPQYDYIVVGGGSAGCVLAARLSEDPQTSVLLLEAGGDGSDVPWLHVPALAGFLSALDWGLRSEPLLHAAQGTRDKTTKLPRGKGLGGTGLLNHLVHNMGSSETYDRWVSEFRLGGWGWDRLLPYFRRLEGVLFPAEGRGGDGPLPVSMAPATEAGVAFLEAVRAQGLPVNADYNRGTQEGFSRVQLNTARGWRVSAAEAYLRPAAGRDNLHVVTGATVSKVNVDESGRAVGVDYAWESKLRRVLVNYEIVLSAGVYGSPKLLLLSGIGPREQLERLKIPLVRESPLVGANLVNSVAVTLHLTVDTPGAVVDARDHVANAKAALEWALAGRGPLSWTMAEALGFLRSEVAEPGPADVQLYFLATDVLLSGRFADQIPYSPQTAAACSAHMSPQGGFTLGSVLNRPRSRGSLQLTSADPMAPPKIDLNLLADERDSQAIVEGIHLLRSLAEEASLTKHGARSAESTQPGCEGLQMWGEEYIRCVVRQRSFGLYHECGTCAMGANATAVLDPQFRVRGIRGLRVVDTSIFPELPSGNTNVPVIMAAEKAVDAIKADVDEFRSR